MKFKSASCDQNGTSYVIYENLEKEFIGTAKVHPDDTFNAIRGGRYAEVRAMIKALKYELRFKKRLLKECQDFVTSVSQYKNFEPDSKTARCMYRQINRRKKEVEKLKERIKAGENFIKDLISADDIELAKNKAKEINS